MNQDMQVLTSSQTEEWYTPRRYIGLVERVFGSPIDLDPASSEYANGIVWADQFFSKEDDGLTKDWHGKVFLNPPYGKTNNLSNQEIWMKKLELEYVFGNVTEAIALINSRHGYKWYEDLWTRYAVCCVRDRIHFIKEDGTTGGAAKCASTFLYMGPNNYKFGKVFHEVGRIIFPIKNQVWI